MKTTFHLDRATGLRTASIVFAQEDGARFVVDAAPGEDAWQALQRYLCSKSMENCTVQIEEIGKCYRATYLSGRVERFTAIL
jgi:hypothetical protein